LLPGFATFLAIVLHKPLDAMAITTLMAAGGWKTGWRQAVNALFGLMCPTGVILFLMSVGRLHSHEGLVVGSVLAFSAGIFLCIAVGDLMPEIQLHSHDRFKLSALLVLGVLTAYLTGVLERQGHSHAPQSGSENISPNDHGHGDHKGTEDQRNHDAHSH
jgi:zinc and cadmium transporter